MPTITLQTLKLRNFKGIREFPLDPQGADVSVFGDNATGKTTLRDAFTWLLFDKDSAGRKEFEIKTLTPEGEPLHHLEHEVEGILAVDGATLALRKVFTEKWTKKRGSATQEFTGHETSYHIDGVPVQKGEYTARVAAILPETMPKMLTDPAFFSEQMPWRERRQILLTVCGDVTDADVIASNPKLADLPGILGSRKLEDHKKVVDSRRKEVNKELETLPVRIDEADKGLPSLPASRVSLENKLTDLRAQQAEKVRIDAGGEVAELTRKVRETEAAMLEAQNRIRGTVDQEIERERTALGSIRTQIDEKRREIRRLETEEQDAAAEMQRLYNTLENLRQQWREINATTCDHSADTTCAACGQALPADRVAAAHEKALALFNEDKARKLEANNAEGKRHSTRYKELQAASATRQETLPKLRTEVEQLEETAKRLDTKIADLRNSTPDYTKDAGYQALAAKKAVLEQEIQGLRAGTDEARAAAIKAIADLDAEVQNVTGELAKFSLREQGEARISELKDQQKKLAGEWERLERELWLIEEFTETQARMLTDRVNAKFKLATFKMFNQQVNGGKEPCCEVLYGGVPYTTALNTGAKINVGLDIINTLSEHYEFVAPIWVDNAEAVTRLIPTRAQVIKLVVQPQNKCVTCGSVGPESTCRACGSEVQPYNGLRVETARVLEREAV